MTATVERPSTLHRARAAAVGWRSEPTRRLRRNRGRIAAGVGLMVLFGWLGAVVFTSVGSRKEVLAVAKPVDRYEAIERSDLKVVRVAADPDVATVSASRLDDLVGRVTASDLTPGTLLASKELLAKGHRPIGSGDAVVGTLLEDADSPTTLPQGSKVHIIVRPAAGTDQQSQTITGWILDVGDRQSSVGDARRVSLVVPEEKAATVSAAAADKRVTVVVLGGS